MDLERSRIADRLLERALEWDAGARSAFIAGECGGDDELEGFVRRLAELAESPWGDQGGGTQSLLDASSRSGPPNRLVRELVDEHRARASVSRGTKVGPFRVLREIGRGGMGVVYQGERSDGHFDQTVALKLLPRGGETRDAIARFERERQILAGLVHPNIAHLLDGGVTSDGVPYFAMEYVEGPSIDEHCDQRRLSLDERIRLFVVAARAVEFANSRLIAHGDIKPSHLRVTSTGDVMLLDFGIARLVAGDDHPGATRTRTRILTPEYASPEQVLGKPLAIASDVYQLGLLLYELLTGRRAQPVADSTPAAFEQAVCREEPPIPSTRWSDEEAERHARARSTTPAAARRRLRGDLDNIVMMALRKEPERRYRSVGRLIDDLERRQNRMPVLARPDTWAYRARRFVARHRVGLAASGGLAALLIAYAATVTVQSHRLELEAIKANQVKDVLLRALTAENPALSELPRPTATDLLEDMARAVRESSPLDPLVRAELLSTMGETFRKLDRYDEARGAFAEAAVLRAAHLPPGHLDRTLEEFERGLMAWEVGSMDEARPLFESVIERRRRALGGADDLLTIQASGLLATVLYDQGHYEQAIATMRQAIARRERTPGEGLPYPPRQWANVGYMLAGRGDLEAGEAALRRAIDLARAGGAPLHTLSGLYSNLAATLSLAARHEEARRQVERAIEIRSRFNTVEHSHMTRLLLQRLEILVAGGWAGGEAVAGLAELEEILSGVEGGSSRYPLRIVRLRARIAALEGDSAVAERIFRELVAGAPPPGRAARAFARDCLDLARLLMRRDDPEAAQWLRLADGLLLAHVLPTHPDRVLVTRLLDESERSPEVARVER